MHIGRLTLDSNLFLAPMAGYTDRAFRMMAKRHGAGMVFTEMVSAKGLLYANRITARYLRTAPEEYPLSAQVFGAKPEDMAEAARSIVEQGIAAVDINMGCPVRKVIKSGAGAALLQDRHQAEKIMSAVRKAVPVPLTVKIRSGWDSQSINCQEMAAVAQDCGMDALVIHPRTARQLFTGRADWSRIREVKESVSIPVIGNGDVKTYEDVFRMEAETGCDGVMIGRGALGNPWIFQQVLKARTGDCPRQSPSAQMKLEAIVAHVDLLEALYGEQTGLNRFKAHVLHYLKGIPGAKTLRHQICSEVKTVDELRQRVRRLFEPETGAGHEEWKCWNNGIMDRLP